MEGETNKEKLRKETAKYQLALEKEIDILVSSTKSTLKNVLIIGGTLTVCYLLIRKLTKPRKTNSQKDLSENETTCAKEPTLFEHVSEIILKELSLYLLSYAKEKILNYLDSIKEDDE